MSLTNLTPVEVDVLYLERLHVLEKASSDVGYARSAVVRNAGKHVYVYDSPSRDGHYVRKGCGLNGCGRYTLAEVEPHLLTLQACLSEGLARPQDRQWLESAEAAEGEAQAACQECESEYESRPWARYWLVVSSDGHIHSSRSCCTCNKGKAPTRFALAAYLSGSDVETAVADLGPALCSVCYPDAPVESKEQARISSKVVLALAEQGCEAFKKARQEAQEKAQKRSADRCLGSGQVAVGGTDRWGCKCPVCGCTQRKTSTGKVIPHNAPKFIVRQRYGSKCWTGSAWGTSAKAAIYGTKAEADAVAVQVSTPDEKAESCRK